jgi:nucleoside-diphosphate-sugar epimerase
MRVLVTGGSGFVGTILLRRLAGEGLAVRATYRRGDPLPQRRVEWWPLPSLHDESRLAAAVAECDAVVHLAGLSHQPGRAADHAAEFRRINTEGTRLIARAAARSSVRRFVFISSIAAVCTRSDAPVDDRTPAAPTDAYGRSKLEAEQALIAEFAGAATDWCILRPPLVYGPGNPGNLRRLLQLIGSGAPLPFASIHNRRSFMYVDNLVDALLCVLRHEQVVRSTYVLCDGSDFSTPELVRALATATGRRARLLAVPASVLRALGRAGDAVHSLLGRSPGIDSSMVDRLLGSLTVDATRFRRSFDWQPRVGPLQAFEQLGDALRR